MILEFGAAGTTGLGRNENQRVNERGVRETGQAERWAEMGKRRRKRPTKRRKETRRETADDTQSVLREIVPDEIRKFVVDAGNALNIGDSEGFERALQPIAAWLSEKSAPSSSADGIDGIAARACGD